MDVLLVNAPVKKISRHASLAPPLGLLYIAATLKHAGYTVKIIDFNVGGLDLERLKEMASLLQPKVVGISTQTETFPNALRIARAAKEASPEAVVVAGGPHPTLMYQETLSEPAMDVVVIGEGEGAMLELVNLFIRRTGSLEAVKGIAYRDGGAIKTTGEREFIKDPDILPHPERALVDLSGYEAPATLLSSRGGCPYGCRYCAVNNIWKGTRRYRKPASVVEEMMSIVRGAPYRNMLFMDDIFTLNKRYVYELCSEIKKLGQVPFTWICTTRADLVDESLLREMRSAGCSGITYGVETGSQQIMEEIGKSLSLEQVKQAVSISLGLGMEVDGAFMFPHPQDTEQTVREQMRFMKLLVDMGAQVSLSYTSLLPGTYYYEHMDELGINLLTKSWDEHDMNHITFTTRSLSQEQLMALADEIFRYVGLTRYT
jgi:anaerobic magnesium-protoporphyrin IX monomethyl ester cyclase